MNRLVRKHLPTAFVYIILIVLILLINMPFLSMLFTSLKERGEALSSVNFLPKSFYVANYSYVMGRTTFARNLLNSFTISIVVTTLCIIFAGMAGYALSRFRGKIFSAYSILLLVLQLFPAVLLLIPLFLVFTKANLVNTRTSLIIAYTAGNLPFSIWMIRGFVDTISFEIEQAAMIDGATQFQAFWKIVLPLSMPGISTVAIFTFINSWGEYTLASILIRSQDLRTLTVGLQQFVLQYTSDWPALMTAATIATIPTLLFLVFAQKYLVQGMTAGAVKG